MALDRFLLDMLEDPIDHGPLTYVEGRNLLYNPRRHVAYEVRGAIPVMLPDEARAVEGDEHDAICADPSGVLTGPSL